MEQMCRDGWEFIFYLVHGVVINIIPVPVLLAHAQRIPCGN